MNEKTESWWRNRSNLALVAFLGFGDSYRAYMRKVPPFVPRFSSANVSRWPPTGETGGN